MSFQRHLPFYLKESRISMHPIHKNQARNLETVQKRIANFDGWTDGKTERQTDGLTD